MLIDSRKIVLAALISLGCISFSIPDSSHSHIDNELMLSASIRIIVAMIC